MEEDKFEKLWEVIYKVPREERPRVLIIDERRMFICHHGLTLAQTVSDPNGFISNLEPIGRGEILDVFSKIEFIINDIFINFFKPDQVETFEKLLDYINLFSKINLLNNLGLLDNELRSKIICVTGVRNGLAHTCLEETLNYRGKDLHSNFDLFKEDLLVVWNGLASIHQLGRPDIDGLIEFCKKKLRRTTKPAK